MSTGRTARGVSPRRAAVGGIAVIAVIAVTLAVASMAWACTTITGLTWYSDGTFSKSGPSGSAITAFATGARPNSTFNLVSGNDGGDPAHADHACMFNSENINPTVRTSSSTGFLGNTSGTINRPAGEWQICFRELNGRTGTAQVTFTIV